MERTWELRGMGMGRGRAAAEGQREKGEQGADDESRGVVQEPLVSTQRS